MKPVYCRWTGGEFVPVGKHSNILAQQQYVTGETYLIEPAKTRSKKDHAHFMALVHTAWENLPEAEYDRFPNADALRHDAAINTNNYDIHIYPCRSPAEVKWCLEWVHRRWEYAHVFNECDHDGRPVVVVKTAKSMSFKSMNQKEFHAVKQDIIDYLSAKIGVDLATLSQSDIYTP